MRQSADPLQRKLLLSQCFTIICILFLLGQWQKGTEWIFWCGAGLLCLSLVLQGYFMVKILKARKKK
ncbi:MAG: hypothetical protein IKS22_11855 [Bacteroidales bacterium]|jgi:hypothetical protein|nr:hypothetical protein [Bacteroidales bacterium]